jgi:hydrogenase-4 component F
LNPFLLVAAIPLSIALLGMVPRFWRWIPWTCAVLMLGQVAVVGWFCLPAWRGQALRWAFFGLDGIGAVFTLITTLVAAAAMLQAALVLPAEQSGGHPVSLRRFTGYYSLSGLFILAMYGVTLAQHLGLLWVAVEATTLMSVPLISYHQSRASLEATWKYLLLCSVGIAFALFGTTLIYAAQIKAGAAGTMDLPSLLAQGNLIDPRLLELGFIFCLLGYGTKAGIFPLHSWLPDAHSEAPATASALLSGALLNCALVAVWRLNEVMAAAGQGGFARGLLVPAGALTVFAASLMLIRQHDLKRMLAYSSVEHVGLLTLAIGIGAGPVFMLHALNHSIVKVAFFLLAGVALHVYGTKTLSGINGVLKSAPALGIALVAACFAIAGSPPFGTFVSEWLLLRETIGAGEILAALAAIVGLTIAFVAITGHVGRIVFGPEHKGLNTRHTKLWTAAPAVLLAGSLALGLLLPPPAWNALKALVHLEVR